MIEEILASRLCVGDIVAMNNHPSLVLSIKLPELDNAFGYGYSVKVFRKNRVENWFVDTYQRLTLCASAMPTQSVLDLTSDSYEVI